MFRRDSIRLRKLIVTWVVPAMVSGCLAIHLDTQAARAEPFAAASVRFEQNATDGDVEVVFEAKGGDHGLQSLRVTAPDGRVVIDFTAPDASTLGIRQFQMESPEPKDVNALKAAYPEGVYRFTGRTHAGETFTGASSLSHHLPPTAEFVSPAPGARNVPVRNVTVTWRAPQGIAHTIIEIEQDDLGTRNEATVPGNATSFAIPEGFLRPGTEYQLAIGTIGTDGNISFVETTFKTRP